MTISPALLTSLFTSSTATTTDLVSTLLNGATQTATAPKLDPISALRDAEANSTRYISRKAAEPLVQRDLVAFETAVRKATSVKDFFKDTAAVKVLLTANGLGDFAQYRALVERTLTSDASDDKSLAARLGAQRPAWLDTTETYDFHGQGLAVLKKPETVVAIRKAYAEVLWRQSLDASAPGVSAALSFKSRAAGLDTAYKILGDPVGREVITTALGLPPQIAYQPVISQAGLIERGLDIQKLKNPAFVDTLVKRYLILRNGGSTSITA
jgi:Protein of unknown function (DUF1217)